jgi:hypothetical protein
MVGTVAFRYQPDSSQGEASLFRVRRCRKEGNVQGGVVRKIEEGCAKLGVITYTSDLQLVQGYLIPNTVGRCALLLPRPTVQYVVAEHLVELINCSPVFVVCCIDLRPRA